MVVNGTDNLKGLIENAAERHGKSVRQLASLAQGAGHKVTYTTLNHIRGGTYKSTPGAPTLRAIAYLAGVEESVAFAAAGQPVPGPPLADELPPGADNLSPKSRKAVVEMVRVLVDLESNNNDTHAILKSNPNQYRGDWHEEARQALAESDPTGQGQKMLANRHREDDEQLAATDEEIEAFRKGKGRGFSRATQPHSSSPDSGASNDGIVELHGDEARNIPVPPREQLAAHPKMKTKREQLNEEIDERETKSGDDPEA
ncbi:hypothetical protein [Glutamicibacter nicotianae]|uniref:hypothetical protein n=1 Tax=Glutamicibacter nicotianae TaxID=37929 RepID=UPI0025538FEB|nr:hypothetical protein [Glutamicibacter nicotianae]WIV42554.1 hypothetical protein QQS42_09440 [Glutamicibacter nicotianae]